MLILRSGNWVLCRDETGWVIAHLYDLSIPIETFDDESRAREFFWECLRHEISEEVEAQ